MGLKDCIRLDGHYVHRTWLSEGITWRLDIFSLCSGGYLGLKDYRRRSRWSQAIRLYSHPQRWVELLFRTSSCHLKLRAHVGVSATRVRLLVCKRGHMQLHDHCNSKINSCAQCSVSRPNSIKTFLARNCRLQSRSLKGKMALLHPIPHVVFTAIDVGLLAVGFAIGVQRNLSMFVGDALRKVSQI